MAEESKQTEDQAQSGSGSFLDSLPLDDLKTNFSEFASAWGENALKGLGDKVTDFVDRMSSGDSPMGQAAAKGAEKLAEGESPLKAGLSGAAAGAKEQVKEAFGGGSKSGGGKKQKVTNIVESVDVGVPI